MQGVSNLLNRSTDVLIPPPISMSPTLSTIYLCAGKIFKPSTIKSIEFYPPLKMPSLKHVHITTFKVARTVLAIGADLAICYFAPRFIFDKSHLVHAIRTWAAS